MNPRHLLVLALCLALAPWACAGDEAPAPCVIVFGQGRNAAENDTQANALWDNVNLAFNAEVAARLQDTGMNVVALVLRVTATDLQGNVEKLLARASIEHCSGIVETTVFADYASGTLVARIRDYPLVGAGEGSATQVLRIGAARYVVERNFELTRTTLDRVRPAALAKDMAGELIAQGRR